MGVSEHGVAIPHGVQNKLGDGRLEKGRWGADKENSIYIIAWDFAEDCKGEDCPLYEKCEYIKSWRHRPDRIGKKCGAAGKCEMQQRYLKNVMKAVVDKMQQSKSSRETVIKLGYHLIPLYAQLFKFKMWEYTNKDLVIYSQGGPKVHPVYKEMREIIKTLTSVWKDIQNVFKAPVDTGRVGDGAFIDAMYNVAGEEAAGEISPESTESSQGTGIDFESEGDSEEGSGDDFESILGGDEKPKKKQKPMTKAQRKKHNERRRVDKRKSPMGGNRKKRKAKSDVVPYHGNARKRQEAKKASEKDKESSGTSRKRTRKKTEED